MNLFRKPKQTTDLENEFMVMSGRKNGGMGKLGVWN